MKHSNQSISFSLTDNDKAIDKPYRQIAVSICNYCCISNLDQKIVEKVSKSVEKQPNYCRKVSKQSSYKNLFNKFKGLSIGMFLAR